MFFNDGCDKYRIIFWLGFIIFIFGIVILAVYLSKSTGFREKINQYFTGRISAAWAKFITAWLPFTVGLLIIVLGLLLMVVNFWRWTYCLNGESPDKIENDTRYFNILGV